MRKPILFFCFGAILATTASYLLYAPRLKSQERSASEWESHYNKMYYMDCKHIQLNEKGQMDVDTLMRCSTEISLQAQVDILSTKIASLSAELTRKPREVTTTELPSWCATTINAYMKLGYSRSVTNQLLKKDYPECAN